ncbi:VapC toxin family PIN domain ribonuclease [cyanobacterium TDX16]|nr:VapC toxin family PIN domain ribonuclease [cyanobacterium TDX16]
MSTYVDTSTLLKLLVDEPGTSIARDVWTAASALTSVPLTQVEARAGLAAAARSDRITQQQLGQAKRMLADLVWQLDLIEVSDELVALAGDVAEDDALRGYDAVHLAAALLAGCDVLTSADRRLLAAAEQRGLLVVDTNG